jgi:hypothetical protein
MNRRGFLGLVAALPFASAMNAQAEQPSQIKRLCQWKFKSVKCQYVRLPSSELRLSRADAERLFKIAGNFDRLRLPSYGAGGVFKPLHK